MDVNLAVGILGLIISTVVAYHVAGSFSRRKVRVAVGALSDAPPSGASPWAVVVVLPEKAPPLTLVDIPVLVTSEKHTVRDVWIQLTYPKGRHGPDFQPGEGNEVYRVLNAGDQALVERGRPQPEFDGQNYRVVTAGDYTMVEFVVRTLRPDDEIVAVDRVVFRRDELHPARFEGGDPSLLGEMPQFRWTAERATLTVRAEGMRETRQPFWLAALASGEAVRDQAAAFLGELLMRRDGVRVRKAKPGGIVFSAPRRRRNGLLVVPVYAQETDSLAIGRLADGHTSVQDITWEPVGNLLSPMLSDERA